MAIRCCRCGRPISKSAAPPQPGGGTEAYGPKCARDLGLMPPPDLFKRQRRSTPRRKRIPQPDTRQLTLPE